MVPIWMLGPIVVFTAIAVAVATSLFVEWERRSAKRHARVLLALDITKSPHVRHSYTSEMCIHGLHHRCRADCLICASECRCPCHRHRIGEADETGPRKVGDFGVLEEPTPAA